MRKHDTLITLFVKDMRSYFPHLFISKFVLNDTSIGPTTTTRTLNIFILKTLIYRLSSKYLLQSDEKYRLLLMLSWIFDPSL